jgi:hypothetical protein
LSPPAEGRAAVAWARAGSARARSTQVPAHLVPRPRLRGDPAAAPGRAGHDLVPAQLSVVLRAARPGGGSPLPRGWRGVRVRHVAGAGGGGLRRAGRGDRHRRHDARVRAGEPGMGGLHRPGSPPPRWRTRVPGARPLRPDLHHRGLPRHSAAANRAARVAGPAHRAWSWKVPDGDSPSSKRPWTASGARSSPTCLRATVRPVRPLAATRMTELSRRGRPAAAEPGSTREA